ncbi:rhodanese-like domain-containing protein [Patescibacteria group bacterium]|nr:rhodanese-like domain-containing protein [Patescibacteria group bacterium]MBU1705317.1 rhodanese-like domain-containing protein [Patescibacteria group bacterium]
MKEISAQGLKTEIEKKENPFTLVDVRDPFVYREKHIPEAVNVPKGADFIKTLSNTIAAKDTVLVFYDDHEEYNEEVKKLAEQAEAAGYTQVNVLKDGFLPWLESGGKVMFGTES